MQDKISERRLQRIVEIINNYDCGKPLNFYLKDFFRSHPEMGSTDRRIASTAVYNFYRLGRSLAAMSIEERISIAAFLFGSNTSPFTEFLFRNYSFFPQDEITFPLDRKVELVHLKYPDFKPENVFPFKEHVSSGLDFEKFAKGLFVQPKLWIRVRSGYIDEVKKELKEKDISFEEIKEFPLALGLENNIQLQQLISLENGYFEVQDLSSQQTGNYLSAEAGEDWWDCCAGAGGKSLILKDKFPDTMLLATDIRPSILQNLELRFKKAGIKKYTTKVLDLEKEDLPKNKLFDGIICDVPCSGSGTWSRTPESISCFSDEKKIIMYQQKQKDIVSKASTHLKKDGKFIFITCSVFKEENEDVVSFIQGNHNLKLKETKLIDGAGLRADTLFVAVFQSA